MSDPVTNSEVEDVLASIRRLVGGPKKSEGSKASDQGQDRLLLTPQQRVSESDVFQLRPEHALDAAEGENDPDQSDDSEVRSAEVTDNSPFEHDDFATVEDHSESDEEPESAQHEDESAEEPSSAPHSGMDDSDETDEGARFRPPLYSDLTQKIAALETAIARTQDQWDPDGESGDAYAGTQPPAMSWPENVELDGTGKPVVPSVEPTEPMDAAEDDDAQIIDEDTLREMVTEIVQQELANGLVAQAVRDELQGDLGARITSNIRKLVRREIQLAMTAQGLE